MRASSPFSGRATHHITHILIRTLTRMRAAPRENSAHGIRPPRAAAAGSLPPSSRPQEPPLAETGHPPVAEGRGRPDGLHHGHADPEEGPEGGRALSVAGDQHAPRGLQVRCCVTS